MRAVTHDDGGHLTDEPDPFERQLAANGDKASKADEGDDADECCVGGWVPARSARASLKTGIVDSLATLAANDTSSVHTGIRAWAWCSAMSFIIQSRVLISP